MNIVIVGHVDHGKSTVVGRLLVDTDSLPQGKLEQVRIFCERNSRPFEYAFLLDALRDERAQGITIDTARIFFKTQKRRYVIHDAPGHIEFLKNMVSGASHAEAAFLVIDANEGIQENSKRHAYLLSMLGIRQIAVLINKMDLLNYEQRRFNEITAKFKAHLDRIGVKPAFFIPTVGVQGENIAIRSTKMPWYSGPTVLQVLDGFESTPSLKDLPLRMPVQDIYKFTAGGDNRRIVAGTIESGVLRRGDGLRFSPSGKQGKVKSLEFFPEKTAESFSAGQAIGFTLEEQIYVSRGEIVSQMGQSVPEVSDQLRANVFWLGKRPLQMNQDYLLKLGTARVKVQVEKILSVLDASSLDHRSDAVKVERNEVAECVFHCAKSIAFDLNQLTPGTTRFVLVDDFEISGGGIIREN